MRATLVLNYKSMVAIQLRSTEELAQMLSLAMSETDFMRGENGLNACVSYVMGQPGKRFRPLLLMQVCELFGGEALEAVHPALAMEVFHNFTLVHDDIMDKAELRRGHPTAHRVYGENNAIIAGDMLMCHAYALLAHAPVRVLPEVLMVFSDAAMGVMEGQHMDMDFELRSCVTEADYLLMIEKKTSVLLAASVQIGALIAGASKGDQQRAYDFGKYLGLMFQIKDDLLDTFGTEAEVGKRIGGDILQNKQTYLKVMAYQLADTILTNRLNEAYRYRDEDWKVAAVTALFEETGARKAAEAKMKEYHGLALKALQQMEAESERKVALHLLTDDIYKRRH